jgi:hypothetical protein
MVGHPESASDVQSFTMVDFGLSLEQPELEQRSIGGSWSNAGLPSGRPTDQ